MNHTDAPPIRLSRNTHLFGNGGFTLLEMAIVLSVVGIIMGLLWISASIAIGHHHDVQLAKQTAQIIHNSKRVFGNTSAPPALGNITTGAITAGIFPSDMVVNATTVMGPYSNPVNLSVTTAGAQTLLSLAIDLPASIPSSACASLLSELVSSASVRQQLGLVGYEVNGGGTILFPQGAITEATIIKYCPVPAAGVSISLDFTLN